MAVSARLLGNAGGGLDPLQRLGEQALELLQAGRLRTQLEQCLLGGRRDLERRGHAVGAEPGERLGFRARVRDPLDEVRIAGARTRERVLVDRGIVVEQLDVARGVGEVADAALEPEWGGSFYEDVEAAVLEPLEHLGDARRAADVLQRVLCEPYDPELALLLEALPDHQLVALLEDVERNHLARQQHKAEGKQRKALDHTRHGSRLVRCRPALPPSRFFPHVQGTRKRADSHFMSIEVTNGLPEGADQGVSLELTLAEAEAVKSWLLKPSADGSAAIDDENAKSVMVKLGAKLDYIQGVQRVRDELEQAGFATEQMSDDDVAVLGRRIAESPIRRYSGS